MSAKLANCSNINRQIRKTSGLGHTQHNPPSMGEDNLLRHGKRYMSKPVTSIPRVTTLSLPGQHPPS